MIFECYLIKSKAKKEIIEIERLLLQLSHASIPLQPAAVAYEE
jgi:hypothetical protein